VITAPQTTAGQTEQYLTFFVAEEEYGVAILRAREIVEFDTLTRVPQMPACVRGVINLRGSVVPIVDLAAKLGLRETAPTRFTCVVILEVESEGEREIIGLLVDHVGQVIELGGEDIQPTPTFGTRIRPELLRGMGRKDKKFVMLLDIDRLLAVHELLALAASVEQGPATEGGEAPAGDVETPAETQPPAEAAT
jgi:purine-binding chemotaxis protein CheW